MGKKGQPGKQYEVSMELAQTLKHEYNAGGTLTTLSTKHKLAKATVARNIRRAGGTIRPVGQRKVQTGLLGWLNTTPSYIGEDE